MRFTALVSLIAVAATLSTAAVAQGDVMSQRVQFAPGASSTVIEDVITGRQVKDYRLGAAAGQTMHVLMYAGSSSVYFNILPPSPDFGGQAIFIGATEGREFSVVLPEGGDYTIRTYLLGAAMDEGRTVSYQIEVSITGEPAGGGASGAGAQSTWTVTGVPAGDILNVRAGPGVDFDIVGALGNGDQVGNLGCQDQGSSVWCRIGFLDEMGGEGWVNARYLVATAGGGGNINHGGADRNLCANAVANQVGVSANDVVVTNTTISEATGYTVVYVGVPYATADWICEIDRNGRLVSVFFGG